MGDDPKTTKTPSSKTTIVAAILLAAAAIAPFTTSSEGSFQKAYLDPIKKPTICEGHTNGVKMGDVATKEQCAKYLKEDMAENMEYIVKVTPQLVENTNALQAAGDFSFNAGLGNWKASPMAASFVKRDWVNGCNAFVGYFTAGTFSANQPKYKCRPKPGKTGKWLCELPGLVKRRLGEQRICLTGH